jgi:hypothetical protein
MKDGGMVIILKILNELYFTYNSLRLNVMGSFSNFNSRQILQAQYIEHLPLYRLVCPDSSLASN